MTHFASSESALTRREMPFKLWGRQAVAYPAAGVGRGQRRVVQFSGRRVKPSGAGGVPALAGQAAREDEVDVLVGQHDGRRLGVHLKKRERGG